MALCALRNLQILPPNSNVDSCAWQGCVIPIPSAGAAARSVLPVVPATSSISIVAPHYRLWDEVGAGVGGVELHVPVSIEPNLVPVVQLIAPGFWKDGFFVNFVDLSKDSA